MHFGLEVIQGLSFENVLILLLLFISLWAFWALLLLVLCEVWKLGTFGTAAEGFLFLLFK